LQKKHKRHPFLGKIELQRLPNQEERKNITLCQPS